MQVKIYEVRERTPQLTEELFKIWEASVRATHLFLSDAEIAGIAEYVPTALKGVAHLMIAGNTSGKPAAFMGIEEGRLEMLFITPEERGRGLGKSLIRAAQTSAARRLKFILISFRFPHGLMAAGQKTRRTERPDVPGQSCAFDAVTVVFSSSFILIHENGLFKENVTIYYINRRLITKNNWKMSQKSLLRSWAIWKM